MKNKKKVLSGIFAALGASALLTAGVAIGMSAEAKSSYGEAFDYTQSVAEMKYKTLQSDASDPTKKGLLLYAYDNGASAEFKAKFNGKFTSETKAVLNGNNTDLIKYSLVFTDTATQKQFSVTVANSGAYSDVYVTVNGEKAGIYYYEDAWVTGTYGYTAAYNVAGSYTRFSDGGSAEIAFDPQTMQVSLMGDKGAYLLVWDFTQEYNDGKRLVHDLTGFGEYTVDVVFDEVKSNGKGELLLYSFGDYTFNKAFIDSKPSLTAAVKANAIVGKEYVAPDAIANDLIQGQLSADGVKLSVYDNYGNIINEGGRYAFTPDKAGEYFLYYTYGEGESQATAFYRILAIEESEVTQEFIYADAFEEQTLGVQGTVYVPNASVTSSLSADGYAADALITVKKDGAVVEDYESVEGGFEYTFAQAGVYEFIYATDVFGVPMSETKTVTVSNDVATVLVDEIPEDVEYLSTLTVNPAKVYFGGEEIDGTVRLVYPSGKTVGAGAQLLDELGYYTLVHEYNGETFEQRFAARQRYSELFTSANSSSKYDTMTSNNLIKGQMLSLSNEDTLTYGKLLDFSDNTFDESLEDKSQNTPFIELFMQPKSLGMIDLAGFYVVLTDAADPTNYIEIRMQYLAYFPQCMRIRTRASGQSWVGYDYDFWTGEISVDSAPSHSDGGTIVSLNPGHTITTRDFESASLKLYFDTESGRLYTKTWQDKAGNSTADNIISIPWLIRDFKTNDPLLSAEDTPWKGFTTGEVYLSVYAKGVTDTANLMLLSIDGEDLTKEFVADDVAPTVTVNVEDGDTPNAEVGKSFKVFDYTAVDAYASVIGTGVKVFRDNAEIPLSEELTFIPDSVGTYTVVYSATDSFGNVATKSVDVTAKNSLSRPEIEILGELPETVGFGDVVTLPAYRGFGGAGGVTVSVKVTAVDTGEDVEVKFGQFTCLKEGNYMIEYKATDYIGKTKTAYQWIYDVTRQEVPVFDETKLVLPKAFITGDGYKFGEYSAVYYTEEGVAENIQAKITVTDASGTDVEINGAYVPTASETVDTALVKFIFEKSATSKTVVEREIPILTIKQGLGFLSSFFLTENAQTEAKNDAIYFTAQDGGEMNISFVKAVNHRYLTIGFKKDAVKSFGQAKVILRDVYASNAIVEILFKNTAKGLTCSVNGGRTAAANYDKNGNFALTYDTMTKNVVDVLGMQIGTITTYANGEAFEGFPSGSVYIDVVADGCLGWNLISNQTFNNFARDSITPRITVNGSFSGSYAPGQKIVLPTASAYDVLSAIGEIELRIRTEEGETLLSTTADKETEFIPEKYGSYSVIYSATDSSGNKITSTTSIIVNDDVKPTLQFTATLPTTAKWGDTLTLPNYTVTDNGDLSKASVKIYACSPDGIMNLITDNKVTFTRKGEYTIYYFVLDENNNPANYTFYITVA